jgi:hypothetical protein
MSDWDITLDNVGYMLVPGSYRASHAPLGDGRLGRERLAGFAGGLSGLRAWPAPWPLGNDGVGPAPAPQAVSGAVSSSAPKLTASDRDDCYIVAGTTVYRWDRAIASAPVSRKTLAASATCLARLRSGLFIGAGAAADVAFYDDASNALTASALGSGVTATMLGTFSRGVVLVAPGFPMTLHLFYGNSLTYSRSWSLDGNILGFAQLGSRMIVATDAGLHVLSGEWYQDADPPAPPETLRLTSWGTLSGQLQDDDDFNWLMVYQGRLFAWLGKQVVLLDEGRETWQPAGLAGGATTGAAVVNGWLLVSISPVGAPSTFQLWGYNGSGWWLLDEATGTNTLATPAADGAGRLLTFTPASGAISAWDLAGTTTATTLASPYSVTTPLLDAGEPERRKHWRRAGVELARTDGQPVGNWSAQLAYSTDGGASWTNAGTATSITSRLAGLSAPLDVEGTAILLRITLTQSSGLPPFITAIWVEHTTLDDTTRRTWQFKVAARPRAVNRAGALDPRTAQQTRDALWTLWQAADPIPFGDIDAAPERDVRITSIREEVPKPAAMSDAGASSLIELILTEI